MSRRARVTGLVVASVVGSLGLASAGELRVAVLEFESSGGPEYDGLGKGLQAMITTDLAQSQALKLVERSRLAEIQAELKLGKSGAVDPKTASKIGKLAGASHLLAGGCTVLGGKMRLDARLFAVASGDVLFGEKMEGDKDTFFELEKALVNKLIGAVGVKLLPKERAEIGRVHTADFGAFQKFGQGVKAYDEKRYDDALKALREAAERDKDFKLATLTLDEYQRLITQLQSKTEDLFAAQRSMERAKRDQGTAAEAKLVERLYALADHKGDKAREERLTALHALAVALGNVGGNRGKLHRLRQVEDRFALARAGDEAAKRYYVEAVKLFPRLPPIVSEELFDRGLTDEPDNFDKVWPRAIAHLFQKGALAENVRNTHDNIMRASGAMATMMQLDHAQTVALHAEMWRLLATQQPNDFSKQNQPEELAKEWRSALELDKSTALYTELSRGVDNPWRLKGITAEIETNRKIAELIASARDRELMREYILLSQCNGQCSARELFGGAPSRHSFATLTGKRKLSHDDYTWIGGQPMWPLQAQWLLSTGPRSDPDRAGELRYYRGDTKDPTEPLLVAGGAPRSAFSARFRVDYTVPPDFVPSERSELVGGRPEVRFLFAMRDLDCEKQEDAATQKKLVARPLRALAVVFAEKVVRLVELTEAERGSFGRKQRFDEKQLAEEKLAGDGEVAIKLTGSTLSVAVAGKSVSLPVPPEHEGFTGFSFRGDGFVAVKAPTIEAVK